MRVLISLLFVICTTVALAQLPGGAKRLGGLGGIELRQGNTTFGETLILNLPTGDFSIDPNANPGQLTITNGPSCFEAGVCAGDVATEFCDPTFFDQREVNASAAKDLVIPCGKENYACQGDNDCNQWGGVCVNSLCTCGTSLQTGFGQDVSDCEIGAIAFKPGGISNPDQLCQCVQTTCVVDGDCGSSPPSGACNANRCRRGNTSSKWRCVSVVNSVYGSAVDGKFDFPLSASANACAPSDCPAHCNTCSGAQANLGCTCGMTTNISIFAGSSGGGPSVIVNKSVYREYSYVFIGKKNVVTSDYSPAGGETLGSVLWLKSSGKFILEGDGTTGGKIDMKGKGWGRATAASLTAGAGGTGCGSVLNPNIAGGAGGAPPSSPSANGGNGAPYPSLLTPFFTSLPMMVGHGGARGGATVTTSCATTGLLVANPSNSPQTFEAASGAGGGCNATGLTAGSPTCVGQIGDGGDGGGAVAIDAVDLVIGQNAGISVAGEDAGGFGGGGGSSGDIALRYSTCTYNGGSCSGGAFATLTGGTAGVQCGNMTGGGAAMRCAAGTNGGTGNLHQVTAP